MVIAAAIAACGGREAANHAAMPPAAPPATPIERAHAYERGTGVPRDYRAAAELYRAACDNGRGDVAACGALLRASFRSRGTEFNKRALQVFASKICVDRRDAFCCVAADLLSEYERDIPEPVMAVIKSVLDDMPECDAAHLSACEARLLASVLDFSDSSAGQARRKEFHRQLCTLGFVEGCQEITEDADARRRLAAACDAHDADACAASPDRKPISPRELCAANDYEACGALGCRGDAQAADLATGHGIDLQHDCDRLIRDHEPKRSP
jgi:TPR repeat protein